jgi:hypothetical protein
LELGSKPSIQDPDLQSTRAYKKELAEKLHASSIMQDLSLRVLLHYLSLKEEHLEICNKNCKKLSLYRGGIQKAIMGAFSLSRDTLQKILEDFDQGRDSYETVRPGNWGKKVFSNSSNGRGSVGCTRIRSRQEKPTRAHYWPASPGLLD